MYQPSRKSGSSKIEANQHINHENIPPQIRKVDAIQGKDPSEAFKAKLSQEHLRMSELTKQDVLSKYPVVFEGLSDALHLEVDETVKPVQIPPRGLPEAFKQPLKRSPTRA